MKTQKGSAHVIILIVMIVALVSALGFIFWQNFINSDSSDKSMQTTDKNINGGSKKEATKSDRTDNWLLYTSPGKEFTIRIPDGWKLNKSAGNKDEILYGFNASDIQYKSGTKALIVDMEGGRDFGSLPYMLTYSSDDSADDNIVGALQSTSDKTNAGQYIYKYYWLYTTDTEGMGPPKGTKQYFYLIKKDNTKKNSSMVLIRHDIRPGEDDQRALIEEAIKTLSFK